LFKKEEGWILVHLWCFPTVIDKQVPLTQKKTQWIPFFNKFSIFKIKVAKKRVTQYLAFSYKMS